MIVNCYMTIYYVSLVTILNLLAFPMRILGYMLGEWLIQKMFSYNANLDV